MTVFTPAVSGTVRSPTAGVSASGSYLADIVSAASVDIVSTASRRWTEVRHVGALGATYQPRTVGVSANGSVSSEPDYLSVSGGGRVLWELSDKTVTPTVGYTYGHDTAGKTGTPFSVYSQDLSRHALFLGTELVLDRRTTAFLSLDTILERGDQKKPYRMLPLFSSDGATRVPAGAELSLVNQLRLPGRMAENTPDERNRFGLSLRVARRFTSSTLVLAERAYADDWGLLASTSDARWYRDLGARFLVFLHLRAHAQTGVSFWRRAYVGVVGTAGPLVAPTYRTGDRELSPLLSGTAGFGARFDFGPRSRPSSWAVSLQGDATATDFLNALYVRDRLAEIGILALETEL
ncbi:MAG TPA: DUF3570 domain-containing protein [Polyangiaceae bacterium]|nr:DUF3570 domain-containing protein [Polyangiaceae bacterium]